MKTKLLVTLAAFVLTFAACQKDTDDATDNPGNATEDYQPTSTGSTWQYRSLESGAYTETALGPTADTTIEGEKYSVFSSTGNSNRYVRKSDGVYTSYTNLQLGQVAQAFKLVYLKDAKAGTSWNNSLSYSGIPIDFKFTIASRDGEKTVNGKTYDDVIALDYTVTANSVLLGGTVQVGRGQQFYAKGVGAITTTIHFAVPNIGEVNDSTYLESYTIK